ncbi:MAG TPA: adenylate kinase family protein [Candidatus Thermoplasmatota archaeon]|nr:adenylate kinase family protein [Candidatus Thermoplasmatota archaeon]
MVRVALTGTPGVGKTTVGGAAAAQSWRVVDVKAWARAEGCVVGRDEEDEADVIDVEALAARMPPDDGSRVLYEGHLSHLLGVDVAWVVRCDPGILRERLRQRGYPPAKVAENVEAEALDIILQEALEHVPSVIQRDGSRRTPEQLYAAFAEGLVDAPKGCRRKARHDLEEVDWSHHLGFPG